MMRSMFTGVSALRTHQTRMDVVANNIANVNTIGFKASRVTFADTFSQTLANASPPSPASGRGGTNPMQVGLGMNLSSIQRNMTPGIAQRTEDPFHLMIEGNGMFIVSDGSNQFFTRAGDFLLDVDNNLVTPAGMIVQGWPADWNSSALRFEPIERGQVQGIQLRPNMMQVPGRATGNVSFAGNLNPADATVPSTISFRDSLGRTYRVDVTFQQNMVAGSVPPSGDGTWDVIFGDTALVDGVRVDITIPGQPHTIEFNTDGSFALGAPPVGGGPATGGGRFFEFALNPTGVNNATFGRPPSEFTPPGAGAADIIRIDFGSMTQAGGSNAARSNASSNDVDGREVGRLTGTSIGQDGSIVGIYSNGDRHTLWRVALADFANPAGLEAVGNNLFIETMNSGQFDGIGIEAAAIGSRLLGGAIEMSNVDMAGEFTDMIVTQRGFQANSRTISTSDEMLMELMNLRR